ncbi:class I glutamine amidotransferase-like protein [Bimuria novae-zelandiae CBS 107.79]|uniref:Class I glutamine amidotransferase-like protein n=1 Tax=Bimuria novae-zelandiae CBS 107.79 TaxID=1447943 RepID=A0A6A5UTD7_9PLEO|nr:class I glutamine amidotransferase-like protein [Bimuria novae-zelandiae CBS 107.79]
MVARRIWNALLTGISMVQLGYAQIPASSPDAPHYETVSNVTSPLSIGYIIFPGFTPLDVFGPLELLFQLSGTIPLTLSTISFTTGPVGARSPRPFTQYPSPTPFDPIHVLNPQIIATHTFATAPPLDVIIVPGGTGDFVLDNANDTSIEHFLASRFEAAQYVLSVCVGATTLARAGLLSGRRATTNKRAWAWATHPRHGENITWVPNARWVEDGKVWTSSGVAAGIDMMWAFIGHLWGEEVANRTVNGVEYTPHADKRWDAFAVVHDVPGADRNKSLTDCVRPAGW